jgi:Nif-specific regulatory protein
VQHFLDRHGKGHVLSAEVMEMLSSYDWPGNVRELENCLERASVMTEGNTIDRDAILLTGIDEKISSSRGPIQELNLDDPNLDEREKVIAALEQAGWVQAKAARLLDMTPRQIAYRIQTLNIKVRQI